MAALVSSVLFASASIGASPRPSAPSAGDPARAPVIGRGARDAVKDRYIVVFKKGAAAHDVSRALGTVKSAGGRVHFTYTRALRGFAATLSASAVTRLTLDRRVAYVQADQRVRIVGDQANPPSWGLDRVDQRNLPLNSNYHYDFTGSGVKAYIIDTGLDLDHSDYGGRAINGYDAIDGGNADDCNGHGSHVAGTVGGNQYGVAKGVTLVAVRVLDCQGSGTNSQVIAGIDWVTGNHTAGQPAVANMSLGGSANSALDQAVRNSIADGVSYSLAAGNDNANACNSSPARTAEGITVGATTSSDARASYSNYGTCLDIFAPGSSITSAWLNNGTNTISGTSMATPHVAGAAALYLQSNPSATPQQVRDQLVNTATVGVVTSAGSGSPNRLLYTLGGSSPPPPPPPTGCGLAESYSGSLSGTGDADLHPNGTYFYSPRTGIHRGCLRGPASGADFDLALYRWNGFGWTRVAVSESASSSEDISYSGSVGYYYWRVYSYSGSGSYTFGMTRP
ncbi:MAG: S8 family peptidase [Chloroflexi bacterium]|nr:S8 family peptidase [Chloroflexota bacterium]